MGLFPKRALRIAHVDPDQLILGIFVARIAATDMLTEVTTFGASSEYLAWSETADMLPDLLVVSWRQEAGTALELIRSAIERNSEQHIIVLSGDLPEHIKSELDAANIGFVGWVCYKPDWAVTLRQIQAIHDER